MLRVTGSAPAFRCHVHGYVSKMRQCHMHVVPRFTLRLCSFLTSTALPATALDHRCYAIPPPSCNSSHVQQHHRWFAMSRFFSSTVKHQKHMDDKTKDADPSAAVTAGGAANRNEEEPTATHCGGFFHPSRVIAPATFTNRWLMVVPAFATHMCIGSPWAWSALTSAVSRDLGFVVSCADDWSFAESTLPMQVIFLLQGVAAAVAGKWQMKVGTRAAMVVASLCFGSGLMLGAAGLALHSLPLLYAGYGVLGGTGIGVAYTPPVQALLEWFPDRRGLASGMTIAGFGSGALLFAPAVNALMKRFQRMPEYIGTLKETVTQTIDGRLYIKGTGGDSLREVVLATEADLALLPYEGLEAGYYAVGSGNTGAAAALGTMGAVYLATMLTSALTIRRPHPSYKPAGMMPLAVTSSSPSAATAKQTGGSDPSIASGKNVSIDAVMKLPQFYLLSATFFCVASGGIGIFAVAKPMMTEVFSLVIPSVVTAGFTTKYLLGMAAGNLGGRLAWAAVSDRIGRRRTFQVFTLGSIPLYLSLPFAINAVVDGAAAGGAAATGLAVALPLSLFCMSTVAAISLMGGVYAILPAYEADLFGAKYVSAIHGRFLLASSAAAMLGPSLLMYLRNVSERDAIQELLKQVDVDKFRETFGVKIDQSQMLIDAKTLTVQKLLTVCPDGTVDPSPMLYHSTMYAMTGLLAVAAVSHQLVRRVPSRHYETTTGAATAGGAAPVVEVEAAAAASASPAVREGEPQRKS